MPPKRKTNPKKKRQVSRKSRNTDQSLTQITRMMKQLNAPQNQVTDLGRMLLHGGNTVSQLFGFPKIFGSGAYAMENTLWDAQQQVPIMHSSNESIRFRHREYITDVFMGSTSFSSIVLPINPGLTDTFPFLSSIANAFQEYSFKGLVFEYKSTSAASITSSTNTAMGTIMLAMQYRADAPQFTSKVQLLNEMWSADSAPSQHFCLPVECSPQETVLTRQYVRTGGVGSGDVKMYDLGVVTLATDGAQSGQANTVGELWVSYDIEFYKPQAFVSGPTLNQQVWCGTGTSFSNGSPLNSPTPNNYNSLTSVTVVDNSVIFNNTTAPGVYLILVYWGGSGSVSFVAPSITYTGSARASSVPSGYGSTNDAPYGSSTTASGIQYIYTTLLDTGGSVIFGTGGTLPTGTQTINVFITPWNTNSVFG